MTLTQLGLGALALAAWGFAYLTRSDPAFALPLAAFGGKLVGLLFPQLGAKKVES